MNTERADPAELASLSAAFAAADGGTRPPLGPDAVRAFEAEHGVVLPEPYRTFVTEIANGAADGPPLYGLLPLPADPADGSRDLARPFPLTVAWVWEDAAEYDAALVRRVFDHGSVGLGTDGCGMDWHLVVTGAQRGHVWLLTAEGATPFTSGSGSAGSGSGFADWVGHWASGREWFDAE